MTWVRCNHPLPKLTCRNPLLHRFARDHLQLLDELSATFSILRRGVVCLSNLRTKTRGMVIANRVTPSHASDPAEQVQEGNGAAIHCDTGVSPRRRVVNDLLRFLNSVAQSCNRCGPFASLLMSQFLQSVPPSSRWNRCHHSTEMELAYIALRAPQ
jgi:hypothetical protein